MFSFWENAVLNYCWKKWTGSNETYRYEVHNFVISLGVIGLRHMYTSYMIYFCEL